MNTGPDFNETSEETTRAVGPTRPTWPARPARPTRDHCYKTFFLLNFKGNGCQFGPLVGCTCGNYILDFLYIEKLKMLVP